ncbi:MAG: hypothetical protein WDM76_03025 [Limisphaerales bacterium]
MKNLSIGPGDVVRLQRNDKDAAAYCIVDFVDLENIAPPLAAPANSLSITDDRFGAGGTGQTDDTAALTNCIAACEARRENCLAPPPGFSKSPATLTCHLV